MSRSISSHAASIVCCLIAILVLSAFSIPLRIEMLNNSGSDALISFNDDQHNASSIQIKVGQKVEIAGLLERSFVIQVGGASNRYRGRLLPEAFVDYRGWGPFLKRLLRVRLESNGCISLIPPKKKIGQKNGFPICPDSD
jgi:hypothetical protein